MIYAAFRDLVQQLANHLNTVPSEMFQFIAVLQGNAHYDWKISFKQIQLINDDCVYIRLLIEFYNVLESLNRKNIDSSTAGIKASAIGHTIICINKFKYTGPRLKLKWKKNCRQIFSPKSGAFDCLFWPNSKHSENQNALICGCAVKIFVIYLVILILSFFDRY